MGCVKVHRTSALSTLDFGLIVFGWHAQRFCEGRGECPGRDYLTRYRSIMPFSYKIPATSAVIVIKATTF